MKKFVFTLLISMFSIYAEGQCPSSIIKYNDDLLLREFISGNYTNSGMKEIVAFFQKKSSIQIEGKENYFIQKTFCFLLDKNDLIVKTIPLSFSSIYNTENFNLQDMPLIKLGTVFKFGAVGDFNQNGTDELYLYTLTGYGFYPVFLEFQKNEFRNILPYESLSVSFDLVKVDSVLKKIDFIGTGGEKSESVSFSWDKKLSVFKKK